LIISVDPLLNKRGIFLWSMVCGREMERWREGERERGREWVSERWRDGAGALLRKISGGVGLLNSRS